MEIFIVERSETFEGEPRGWEEHRIYVGRSNFERSEFAQYVGKAEAFGYRIKKHRVYGNGTYETSLI